MKALVTGGGSRVGALISEVLKENGYEVVRHYFSSPVKGGVQADLTTNSGVISLIENAPDDIDLLVNNAGIFPKPDQQILTLSEEELRKIMQISAWSPLKLIQHYGPKMKSRGKGRIIGVLDTSVEKPFHKRPSHTLAKRAHENIIELAQKQLAPEVLVQDLVLDKIIPSAGESGDFIGPENFKELFQRFLETNKTTQ